MKLGQYYLASVDGDLAGPFIDTKEAKNASSSDDVTVLRVVSVKKVTTEWKE